MCILYMYIHAQTEGSSSGVEMPHVQWELSNMIPIAPVSVSMQIYADGYVSTCM